MIADARERAQGDIGTGSTMVLLLLDERGRPVITRLLLSSGRRSLDETALSALMLAVSNPTDSVGMALALARRGQLIDTA
jgi:hypothetical protein